MVIGSYQTDSGYFVILQKCKQTVSISREKMSVHHKIRKLIRRTLLHTLKEWDAVATRDKTLKNMLSHSEGRLRGLQLTDLRLDPSHFRPVDNDFELHLRHDYSTVSTARAFRKGQLIELSLSDAFDNKEEWTKVNGIISEVKGQSIYLQASNLGNNFLLQNLRQKSECTVNLSQRSTKPIIETSAKALKNLKLNRLNYHVAKSIVDPDFDTEPQELKNQPIFMQEDFLDQDKIQAVKLCCECHPLTIIHGPPGTGKTTGLAAVILSALANGSRVLAVAPSHAAVDALTMALLKQWDQEILKLPKSKLIRVGNALRLRDDNVLPYLPKLHQSQNLLEELQDVWKSLLTSDKGAKKMLIKEESELLKKAQKSRRTEMFDQVKHSQVVTSTCLTALAWPRDILQSFDIICIDEAAFAPDWLTLPLILSGVPRIILSGDHCQLPPVVTFQPSITSLMERCIHKVPTSTLTQQFRSNQVISNWSSSYFYQGQLKAHESVKNINLNELVETPSKSLEQSLLFIDTSYLNYFEDQCQGDFEGSYSNVNEAYIVEEIVNEYVDKGVHPEDIGIITPYWSQVALLRDLLIDLPITISTVDGFQGCEKELIIISFVRSNLEQKVGFLEEVRRINVSITRAKRCCIVIGDISTLSVDLGLKSFIDYCLTENVVIKADDYIEQSLP